MMEWRKEEKATATADTRKRKHTRCGTHTEEREAERGGAEREAERRQSSCSQRGGVRAMAKQGALSRDNEMLNANRHACPIHDLLALFAENISGSATPFVHRPLITTSCAVYIKGAGKVHHNLRHVTLNKIHKTSKNTKHAKSFHTLF